MKKIMSLSGIAFLLCLAFALSASTQQGKEKAKQNKQQEHKGNSGQEKAGKVKSKNQGNQPANRAKTDRDHDKHDKGLGKGEKENHGKDKDKDHGRDHDKDNHNEKDGYKKDKDYKGKSHKDKDYYNTVYGYNWDNENFYDRKKIRNQDKVTICHKFSSSNDGVAINVSENAVKAHLNHGDILGDCPRYDNRRYSDVYYRNRTDYYNTLQNTQEQVYYSQSILDYALARLTNGRSQLVTMQNNNAPQADIQRRQQSVVQLEQNVSLLESLIGVAANVVANKLQ
jgi:hypothetical protein